LFLLIFSEVKCGSNLMKKRKNGQLGGYEIEAEAVAENTEVRGCAWSVVQGWWKRDLTKNH
jgi:hypothetical protein